MSAVAPTSGAAAKPASAGASVPMEIIFDRVGIRPDELCGNVTESPAESGNELDFDCQSSHSHFLLSVSSGLAEAVHAFPV